MKRFLRRIAEYFFKDRVEDCPRCLGDGYMWEWNVWHRRDLSESCWLCNGLGWKLGKPARELVL